MPTSKQLIRRPAASRSLETFIHIIRGQKVILDSDIAGLYQVETRTLNQAVRRNLHRFPADFMFRLTPQEATSLRSQIVILEKGRGTHAKYTPFAFTEHGVAMLSSVLRSKRAAQMSIAIVRAFIKMRELIAANKEMSVRIEKLERGQDQTASVIEVLAEDIERLAGEVEQMKAPTPASRRRIGFRVGNAGA
jgi:phage regulator Rha-like protein